jgi:hypothetical protein
MAKGLPVFATTQNATDPVSTVADLFLAWLFVSDILRVCLVLKIVLMLCRFPVYLKMSEADPVSEKKTQYF